MNTYIITINSRAWKACNQLAPKSDPRFYLIGVHVSRIAGTADRVKLTATDGHSLLCVDAGTIVGDDIEAFPVKGVILPKRTAGKIPSGRDFSNTDIGLELSAGASSTSGEGRYSYIWRGEETAGALTVGRYPDCARVIPRVADDSEVPAKAITFSTAIVTFFAAAAQLAAPAQAPSFTICPPIRETNCMTVNIKAGALRAHGIVMPFRDIVEPVNFWAPVESTEAS